MDFSVRRVGRIQMSDQARVVLSCQQLFDEDFRGLKLLQHGQVIADIGCGTCGVQKRHQAS